MCISVGLVSEALPGKLKLIRNKILHFDRVCHTKLMFPCMFKYNISMYHASNMITRIDIIDVCVARRCSLKISSKLHKI